MAHLLSLEALASLPTRSPLLVSHGGDQAVFLSDWTGRFEIYVLDIRTGQRRQVTDGQAPATLRAGLIWSHDDSRVIFSRDENGDERQALFELVLSSGEVRALNHQTASMDMAVSAHPDGDRVLVNSTRSGQLNVHLYHLERQGEAAWTALTAFTNSAPASGFSPDGTRITFTTNESTDLRNTDGYLMNTDGSDLRRVFRVREGARDQIGDWHPNGQQLAVSSDASGSERVGLLTLATGEVRWLTASDGAAEESLGHFSPDGRWLSASRNIDSTLTPVLYDTRTGQERPLWLPPGLASGTEFALGGERLIFQSLTTHTRPEVLIYDLRTDTSTVLLPAEYGGLDPDLFVPGEYVLYPSTDGVQVPAILYLPRGAATGERFPALVSVHGGPTAQFFRTFDSYAQFLVNRGYAVLCPNVRGSTGSGVAWRDANLLDWGGRDLEDVAAGAAYLKTLGTVDPARIGVFGGSYGGYLSYMAAVKTPEVFKVSVPMVGITDLHQLYEDNRRLMPQLGYYFRTMMGDPVEQAVLWRERSPVTHAAALKAHMFMMHGVTDPRCPVSQARGFRDALLRNGKVEGQDFEYLEFENEGHGPGDIAGKTRHYTLLAEYLDRHL